MGRVALWTVIACSVAALSPQPSRAADIPPDILVAPCSTCHGPGGKSPGAIPSLDRLGAEAIRTSLLAFRRGEVQGTIMNRLARGYTEPEIDAIATHLGARTP